MRCNQIKQKLQQETLRTAAIPKLAVIKSNKNCSKKHSEQPQSQNYRT